MKDTKTKENRTQIGTVVSVDGEILNNIYEGDKIVAPKQQEYKSKYKINFQSGEAFVKVFTNPITEMFKELPTKEFAVAMAIMPFISYKDGILRYNNKIVSTKEISEILDESYDAFRRIISSLIQKEILAKVDKPSDTYQNKFKKCLCVNPYIYLRGQDIEKEIVNKFSGSKWANVS